MKQAEFVAFAAMMFATIAFSIDSMLPALPEIGQELSPEKLNRAQLILTSFVLGMGVGTFFTGPLSDSVGRKPVIYGGAALYITASAVAWGAQSLELVLAARVAQGLGAAGPRVVTLAIIRDLYSGQVMARIMSLAMLFFTLVPAIAPALGAVVIDFAGWRAIFLTFILFSLFSLLWMSLRLPETLHPEHRRPFQFQSLMDAVVEMFRHPTVRISIFVQTCCFSMLFTMLTMVQPVYDIVFDRADSFPIWFGAVAIVSGSASLLNAVLVMRLGMRLLVTVTLGVQILLSLAMVVLTTAEIGQPMLFAAFVVWQTTVFFMAGMTLGNLNAIAMEPMGHIAGTAASVIGSIATVLSVALAVPIGLAFNGTPLPLALGICAEAFAGFLLMLWLKRIESRQPATL